MTDIRPPDRQHASSESVPVPRRAARGATRILAVTGSLTQYFSSKGSGTGSNDGGSGPLRRRVSHIQYCVYIVTVARVQ